MGRTAFQFKISLVSIRTCWRFNRVFWRSIYRAAAHWPCVSSNSDSDRILTDVHRRALLVRRRLRGVFWGLMRHCRCVLPIAENRGSPIENGKCQATTASIAPHDLHSVGMERDVVGASLRRGVLL